MMSIKLNMVPNMGDKYEKEIALIKDGPKWAPRAGVLEKILQIIDCFSLSKVKFSK